MIFGQTTRSGNYRCIYNMVRASPLVTLCPGSSRIAPLIKQGLPDALHHGLLLQRGGHRSCAVKSRRNAREPADEEGPGHGEGYKYYLSMVRIHHVFFIF